MRLVALVLLLHPATLLADELPAFYAVTGVAAGDVLNLRAAPDASAAVVDTLAPGATGVEVVSLDGDWAEVSTGENTGYANMRFLRREDRPDWNTLQVPLTCLGTEPFWSLEIDIGKLETRTQTPEDAAVRVAPLTVAWLGSPLARDLAIALPDGIAVLTPAQCSDGMSDRAYGIAIQVFRSGVGYVRRDVGCCHLSRP